METLKLTPKEGGYICPKCRNMMKVTPSKQGREQSHKDYVAAHALPASSHAIHQRAARPVHERSTCEEVLKSLFEFGIGKARTGTIAGVDKLKVECLSKLQKWKNNLCFTKLHFSFC
ncbi:hypothetical protein CAPTEDRAFT_202526 [Capitella teleta]|uniref:Uncharacterized protein n=1 Tax=Capitella teleta TaxID=283909 RepID=R7V5X4_CAPTE|nr:hypothetical protein CAPTEDRAFT_202526 [Capitella teleta]|eukprot:ELU13882.1 hypothetical protein CAPTEDRAFT_202526 [Capitella teleta]